jgi:nucleoside recognition membrane protein YjiH
MTKSILITILSTLLFTAVAFADDVQSYNVTTLGTPNHTAYGVAQVPGYGVVKGVSTFTGQGVAQVQGSVVVSNGGKTFNAVSSGSSKSTSKSK